MDLSSSTNIFILNLAFADFLYCAINFPLYAWQYFQGSWPGNELSCKVNAAFGYLNVFSALMSVAMIAISRCITLTSPNFGKRLFSGYKGFYACVLIWIYANVLLSPIYAKVIGEFGWNCMYGKCDFIPLRNSTFDPRAMIFAIGVFSPGIITFVSYAMIGYIVLSSPHLPFLRRHGTT